MTGPAMQPRPIEVEPMKMLTLHQPWASLVALGIKTIETRSWRTGYRGPLAIQAAKEKPAVPDKHGWIGCFNLGRWADEVVHAEPCDCDFDEEAMGKRCADASGAGPALFNDEGAHGFSLATKLPLGAVVATCTLVDCLPTDTMDGFARIGGWESLPDKDCWVAEYLNGGSPEYSGRVWDLAANRPFGDFTPGRWAWLLDDIEPVDPPVPAVGGQGLTKTWQP